MIKEFIENAKTKLKDKFLPFCLLIVLLSLTSWFTSQQERSLVDSVKTLERIKLKLILAGKEN